MQSKADSLVRDGAVEVFASELRLVWHQLPNKALFGVLFTCWLLLFHYLGNSSFGYTNTASLLKWIWPSFLPADNEFDSGIGMLLPFVVLGLFWWKRNELIAVRLASWPWGLAIMLIALLIHMVGYLVQQQRVSIVGLFLGIFGIMGLAWGPVFLRRAFFPYAFMVFAVPLGSLSLAVTFRLRVVVSVLVEFVAGGLFGLDVIREGTGLFDASRSYQFDVAPACSGIRSLMAILLLCTIYGYMTFRHSWWRWLVMIAAAAPLAVVGNFLRLLVIVLAAEIFGQKTADWVHESTLFSLSPYVPAILGVIFIARWLERGGSAAPSPGAPRILK